MASWLVGSQSNTLFHRILVEQFFLLWSLNLLDCSIHAIFLVLFSRLHRKSKISLPHGEGALQRFENCAHAPFTFSLLQVCISCYFFSCSTYQRCFQTSHRFGCCPRYRRHVALRSVPDVHGEVTPVHGGAQQDYNLPPSAPLLLLTQPENYIWQLTLPVDIMKYHSQLSIFWFLPLNLRFRLDLG